MQDDGYRLYPSSCRSARGARATCRQQRSSTAARAPWSARCNAADLRCGRGWEVRRGVPLRV